MKLKPGRVFIFCILFVYDLYIICLFLYVFTNIAQIAKIAQVFKFNGGFITHVDAYRAIVSLGFKPRILGDRGARIPAQIPGRIPGTISGVRGARIPAEIPAQIAAKFPGASGARIPAKILDRISAQIPGVRDAEVPAKIPDRVPAKISDP